MTEADELKAPPEQSPPLPVEQEQSADGPSQAEPTETRGGHERWILFIIAGLIIALDQVTKYVVEREIPIYSFWAPWPEWSEIFRLTHTTNTGAAFGILPSGGMIFALFAIVVSGAIIYFNQTLEPGHRLVRLALGLQLGGALGNLIDRMRQGYVTDFFDVGPIPIFNIADMAVVVGTLLLGLLLLLEERKEKKEQAAAGASEPVSSSDGGTDN